MDCTAVGWRVQHHVKVKCFLGKEESVTVVSDFSPATTMGESVEPPFPTILMERRVAFEIEEWVPLHRTAGGRFNTTSRSNAS